jgi:uncharacterized iron-regulated protein
MNSKGLRTILLGIALALQVACAGPGLLKHAKVPRVSEGLKVGDIVATKTGDVLSADALMGDMARVRVVYAGESHLSSEDHRVQLQILRGLHARNPSVILALEMFPREVQPLLDEYARGAISEEEFLKQVHWDQIWGYPFALYRGLMTWARDHDVRIIGLNAPREVVSKIARSGLASLSAAERERVARDFHLDDPKHQAYVRRQYQEHLKDQINDFNTFFEAQLAWEETMAETLAQTLDTGVPGAQIVVLIGKGHISDGVGVPMLTHQRVAEPFRTVAPLPIDYSGGTADPRIADYVWITDHTEVPKHRARLGVRFGMGASGKGLEILDVLPGSPAAKAGIKKGDVLTMLDGKPVTSLEEVRRAFTDKLIHELVLKRDGKTVAVTVVLSP